MPAAWEDAESPETQWGDPEAWRGGLHPAAEELWAPDPTTLWAPTSDFSDDLAEELSDEDDWCPGGWLDDWGEP